MTDDEQEVPDFFDPHDECRAWADDGGVIGTRHHRHICRSFPDHPLPHVCFSCDATFRPRAAA